MPSDQSVNLVFFISFLGRYGEVADEATNLVVDIDFLPSRMTGLGRATAKVCNNLI